MDPSSAIKKKKKACMSHIIISPSENFFFLWIKTHLYVNDVRVMMNCKSQKQWLSSPDKSPKKVELGCSLSMELSAANRVAGLDVLSDPQGLSRLQNHANQKKLTHFRDLEMLEEMITCPREFSISPVPSTSLLLNTAFLTAVPFLLCHSFILVPK